jgi:hypothetical protein
MEEHLIYVQGQAEPLSVSGLLVDQVRESLTAPADDGAIVLMQAARRLIMPMRSIIAMESRTRTAP